MLDLSKVKWDMSPEEKYAVKWFKMVKSEIPLALDGGQFTDHGFDGDVQQLLSKTKFTVTKNGVTDTSFQIPTIPNVKIKDLMEQYSRSFELLCKLQSLNK